MLRAPPRGSTHRTETAMAPANVLVEKNVTVPMRDGVETHVQRGDLSLRLEQRDA